MKKEIKLIAGEEIKSGDMLTIDKKSGKLIKLRTGNNWFFTCVKNVKKGETVIITLPRNPKG